MVPALGHDRRERLHETFEALCRIPSPTGHERGVADWIIAELGRLGYELDEDSAGPAVGADAGNLLLRIPGGRADAILLCAHMDTVPLTAPVEPERRDGGWQNARDGILGADNKAAVAAMIELARILADTEEGIVRTEGERVAAGELPESRVGVELLFTVSEETGLNGAKQFDVSRLESRFGYVFDHASPLGEVIVASPTYMRVSAELHGRAAHAGLAPERGVNAIVAAAHAITRMPQGRLDEETTANIGRVEGGTATNVVADRCSVVAEVRAVEQAQLDRYVTEAIDALQEAADTAGCDLDVSLQEMFTGYRVRPREHTVAVATRALRRIGHEPVLRSSGGGSDANVFRRAGLPCTNLANGTENAHERTERVSFAALEANLELMLALVTEASV